MKTATVRRRVWWYGCGFILLSKTAVVVAFVPHAYVGGQAGWGYVHQGSYIADYLNKAVTNQYANVSTHSLDILFRDTGMGERLFAGFQLNRYLAFELGYYHFTSINVNANVSADITLLDQFGLTIPINLSTVVNFKTEAFDFVAKGIWPIKERLSLYGKLGIAYVEASGRARLNATTPLGQINIATNPQVNIVYPEFGLGVNYDLTQHVSGDISWSRIQKVDPCPFPSIDLIAVGLLYKFS